MDNNMKEQGRRNFLKTLSMAAIGASLPIPIPITPTKLVIPPVNSNADMMFGVNGVERMRIMSSGNVGIWAGTPPDAKLHIYDGK
jgi:hypothetical protein